MEVKVTPDEKAFRRFSSAMQQLQKISGQDFKTVVRSEMSAILSAAVRGTPKASVQNITDHHLKQKATVMWWPYPGPTSRTGKAYTPKELARAQKRAGKARTSNGAALYILENRFPDQLWMKIQAKRAKRLKDKLGARGLAASMWVRIADQLQLEIKTPAYVRKAKHAKAGTLEEKVTVWQSGEGNKYRIGFENALTKLNQYNKLGAMFRRVLNGRAKFFEKSVELAALKKTKSVLDRYPGLAKVS
jgi:hypothetical protein